MTATFDITEHADALAEMEAEHLRSVASARPRQEAIAEALALVLAADGFRVARFEALRASESAHEAALYRLLDARAALDDASDLVVQAMEALSILRGGDPHVLRRYVDAAELVG